MFRICTLAVLAIALCSSAAADDFADKLKAKIKEKVAAKMDLSGSRTINNTNVVSGKDNAVLASADSSQNLSIKYREGDITYAPTDSRQWHTTTTDSRQWHLREGDITYAPKHREGNLTYAPRVAATPVVADYVPAPRYVPAAKLSYAKVVDDCVDVIGIRCWGYCGKYFVDVEGRRWNLLATSSPVPPDARHTRLNGRYWRGTNGLLYFTAVWPCGMTRTFVDP